MLNTDESGRDEEARSGSGNGKKLAFALTAIMLVVVGLRVYFVVKARREAQVVHVNEGPSLGLTQDDYIVPRKMYPHTLADARALDGKPIWVFAGSQMAYYPATQQRVTFVKSPPLLLGAEELEVVNFIEQVSPESVYTRIPRGDRQVFMLFHRKTDPGPLHGVAVGYHEAAGYTFYLDEAFFYDDPHVTYKHWPANIWQAIDAHKAVLGMNELQAQLALGQVSRPGPGEPNNRTVAFDNNGHPVTITFEHKKATKIE
ncbi:hypothetical protein [Terriglobus sp.]|uniref:hypothetical protein n=1 Tax=Terriglobus sp. TaxID=1889013 RepID=UPI003AFFCF9C